MQLTSAASARLELLIRRLFALTFLLSSIESFANALSQSSYTNKLAFVMLGVLVALVLIIQISTWFGSASAIWLYVFGTFSLCSMLIWPWVIVDVDALPSEYQPWVWWVIGMGVVAMGVVAKPWLALSYLVITTLVWYWLDTSSWGGNSDIYVSLQDATYIFLFGGTVLGLFFLVRDAVAKVDAANTSAIKSAVQQASTDAAERERQRIDALVHDRVLNTLLLAAKAQTKQEELSVVTLAEEAIESLRKAEQDPDASGSVTPLGLFRALRRAAMQLVPTIEVDVVSSGSVDIPAAVAQALTEATIQALDNASRHSKASRITLRMQSPSQDSVFIELKDNGVGFRLDRIPRDRIGVRTSIFSRLEAVRAKGAIQTEPGQGTTVTLEWKR